MKNNAKTYKVYISEIESFRLETVFKKKSHKKETLNKNMNKKHSIRVSMDFDGFITISIINNLNHLILATSMQKITNFNDISRNIYILTINNSDEYLVKFFIEQKNNYTNRRHALSYNYMYTYREVDYWNLLKLLNPTDTQELLDFCFISIINAKDIYRIENYREILTNKLNYYGLNTDEPINPIEKMNYKEDIYSIFYKMLLYEIVDKKDELIDISTQMRLRRQEKIKDKVFDMYDDFIKNYSTEHPKIYM